MNEMSMNFFNGTKKVYGGAIALLLMIFSFSSCLNNDDGDDVWIDQVSVVASTGGSCYFIGGSGAMYVPQTAYTNPKNIKVASIRFKVVKKEVTDTQKKFTIELLSDPISLDATVNTAATEAKLDSVKNDSILDFKTLGLINQHYLMMVTNYYFSGQKKHYFTLCNALDKNFIASTASGQPDTLRLMLRHNAKKDVETSYTALGFFQAYYAPSIIYHAYDLTDVLSEFSKQHSTSNLYIDVVAKVWAGGDIIYNHSGVKYSGLID